MRSAWIAFAASLCATPALAQQGLQLLHAMDANNDGSITRTEAQAARNAMFDRLDGDDDGYLSESERAAARQAARRRGLDGADANPRPDAGPLITRTEEGARRMFDPDAELVRNAGAGDARAAEALVRRHLPRMVGLARRMLSDASDPARPGSRRGCTVSHSTYVMTAFAGTAKGRTPTLA
jgi:hypothetical protein